VGRAAAVQMPVVRGSRAAVAAAAAPQAVVAAAAEQELWI
jgi:hypothetical protein